MHVRSGQNHRKDSPLGAASGHDLSGWEAWSAVQDARANHASRATFREVYRASPQDPNTPRESADYAGEENIIRSINDTTNIGIQSEFGWHRRIAKTADAVIKKSMDFLDHMLDDFLLRWIFLVCLAITAFNVSFQFVMWLF